MAKKLFLIITVLAITAVAGVATFMLSDKILLANTTFPEAFPFVGDGPIDVGRAQEFNPLTSQVAIVRLSEVLPEHPWWPRLKELEAELELVQGKVPEADFQLSSDSLRASLEKEKDRLIAEHQQQLTAREESEWAQVYGLLEREKDRLQKELQQELSQNREKLSSELADKAESIQKQFQVQILTLRVKAELLDQNDTERASANAQIDQLKQELGLKLGGLEKEYQARENDFRIKAQRKYKMMLEDYTDKLIVSTQQNLENERESLEAKLQEHIAGLAQIPENQTQPAVEPVSGFAELARQISDLRGTMVEEIRGAAQSCAYREGLDTVVLTDSATFGGIDVTKAVITEITKKEGNPSDVQNSKATYTQ